MHKLLNIFCFPLFICGSIVLANGLLGYNVKIEHDFNSQTSNQINTLYEMTKRFRFIDTCLLARMYMREEKATQPILCKKHNIQNDAEHRALGDILALEKLYPIMCSKVSNVLGEDESWLLNNPQEVIETLMIG